MPVVRLTLLQPRPGSETEVGDLLIELDEKLWQARGVLFSLVIAEGSRLGRVSVWTSKEEANREAVSDSTLSLRSRLRYLSLSAEESLIEVDPGPSSVPELEVLLGRPLISLRPAVSS
jgi:hypothetical protein